MHLSLRETPSSHSILRRGVRAIFPASALLILAACGGGGGGGGGNDPPSPPATNSPPTVNAGADAATTLPDATVSLIGSATDDGPASSLAYTWTSSNPTATTFTAANAAATDATFSAAGSYTLTLTVSDGTLSATDTLVVTVNDAAAAVFPADDVDDTDPLHGWQKVEAAAVGMNQAGLDTAAAFAQNVPAGPNADAGSGMIVRHGQLVHSWGDIDNPGLEVKSVTKSMGGIALGLAIDDGKLSINLTDKAIDKMAAFGVPPDVNASKGIDVITIGQLATHTAGFPKPGGYEELQFTPGTTWSYSDGGLNWLADVLTEQYQQDLATLLNTRVWSVLGLRVPDDIRWRSMTAAGAARPTPRAANPTLQYRELASGIQANTNAMARVGLLFLRKGVWKEQRVLSEAFVSRVQTPLPENASLALNEPNGFRFPGATTDYGVLWWTNRSGQMANVPTDAYWAWGLGEALIVVIPSLDLVIARNGGQSPSDSSPGVRAWNDDRWDGDVAVLEPFLDPIVQATTP